MRRAGVGPWIATAAALLLVFFGTGAEIIVYAVNMGFAGALVLGLVQLLLADHDGPVDRRDGLGLLAGLAGLLCSSVALTMIAVVGLATLARRSWRAAVFHTAPLAIVYTAWFLTFQDKKTAHGVGYTHHDLSKPQQVVRFMTTGVRAAFDGMGQLRGAGPALGILLVVGLVLAWKRLARADRRRRLAPPAALLVGAFLFLGMSGIARAAAFGSGFASTSRYRYLVAALVLPALAVAADAVARRWRVLAPAVLVLLLIGLPGNLWAFNEQRRRDEVLQAESTRLMLILPRMPIAHELPRWVRPEQRLAKPVTLGWLLDGVASGRIPNPASFTRVDAATATLHLALQQRPGSFSVKPCRNAKTPAEVQLRGLQRIGIHGTVKVTHITPAGARSRPVTFDPAESIVTRRGVFFSASSLVALTDRLTLRVQAADPHRPIALCVP
jgi:MFS family permease